MHGGADSDNESEQSEVDANKVFLVAILCSFCVVCVFADDDRFPWPFFVHS